MYLCPMHVHLDGLCICVPCICTWANCLLARSLTRRGVYIYIYIYVYIHIHIYLVFVPSRFSDMQIDIYIYVYLTKILASTFSIYVCKYIRSYIMYLYLSKLLCSGFSYRLPLQACHMCAIASECMYTHAFCNDMHDTHMHRIIYASYIYICIYIYVYLHVCTHMYNNTNRPVHTRDHIHVFVIHHRS